MLAPDFIDAFIDQSRAAIDKAGVKLYQRGACIDLFRGIGAIQNAANADQRNAPVQAMSAFECRSASFSLQLRASATSWPPGWPLGVTRQSVRTVAS